MRYRILAAIVTLGISTVAAHGTQQKIETKEVVMDLSALTPGKIERISAPAGENLVVRVTNKVFSADYRYRIEWGGGTPAEYRDLYKPSPLPKSSFPLPQECADLQKKVDAVIGARSESDIPELKKSVEEESSRDRCRVSRMIRMPIDLTERSPGPWIGKLEPNRRVMLTLERIDPISKQASSIWTIEIESKGETPSWHYRTEGEWLVSAVATDIAEMAALALDLPAPIVEVRMEDANTYVVDVKPWGAGEIVGKISVVGSYAWSPDAFKSLAISLLGARAGKALPEPSDVETRAVLLEPTPEAIVGEDLRVSAALNRNLLSPGNHEEAALVISALALRGSENKFSDIRYLLSRTAAHLAMARAFRPEGTGSSASGRWAEATLLMLAGRDMEALAIADRMKSGPADEGWRKALYLRATGDWRTFKKSQDTSLLEWREAFRAAVQRQGHLAAIEMIGDVKLPATTDWGRLLLFSQYPVAVANSVVESAVIMEAAEAAVVYHAYNGSELSQAQWIPELRGMGSGCVRTTDGKRKVAVLGWANWAPFLRQHLLLALHEEMVSLADKLGTMESARERVDQQDGVFSGLEGYWRVLMVRPKTDKRDAASISSGDADGSTAMCQQAVSSLRDHPETVPPASWDKAYRLCQAERQKGAIPNPEYWFQPPLPAGTLLGLNEAWGTSLNSSITTSYLESMQALAPGNYPLAYTLVRRKLGANPTPAEAGRIYGSTLQYDRLAA
jgi:hypothetical protein